jgi:colanic acid/amylovoran biosynthesis glycosyltransferase
MLAVAQFRHTFFLPTNTFIYNYLSAMESVQPICIAYRKNIIRSFPYKKPIIELYPKDLIHRSIRKFRLFCNLENETYQFDLPKTFRTLEHYGVKLLHAHFGYTGCQVLTIKRKTKLPLITTFYGVDISAFANEIRWKNEYEMLFIEGDRFFVEGPYMRRRLIELGCPQEKIDIQRIGLQIDKYPYRPRLPKARNKAVRVLFCGRLQEKKGLLYAIEAVHHVYKRLGNLEFIVIGDGELRSDVEKKIDQYTMGDYTSLLGFQSHESMIGEMDSADIFIHPSVTASNGDSEGGAPTTILEAQACGLPVLSTTHADIPNVVLPGESALLVQERDVEALSNKLFSLVKEQERWATMGLNGRNFVEGFHDISNEVKLLEERYYLLEGNR